MKKMEKKSKNIINDKSKYDKALIRVLDFYNLLDTTTPMDKYKIVCPFHGDVNASLQVDLTNNRFYCYGCGIKGDARQFVKYMEKMDDLTSWLKYETILNTTWKSDYKIQVAEVETPERLMQLAKRYYYSLPKTKWSEVEDSYIQKRGYTSKVLSKVGAKLNPNNDYGIVMPMVDMGEFKGYVCRATNKEVESKRKYLYNKGFTRRNTLVGNYDKNWVVICEGYMDWLRFKMYGVNNVCAILGWKITPIQIEKIKQYTNNVISALDNTDTGKEGTKYLKQFFNVIRYKFPENVKDPGDLDTFNFMKSWMETVDRVRKKEPGIKHSNWR